MSDGAEHGGATAVQRPGRPSRSRAPAVLAIMALVVSVGVAVAAIGVDRSDRIEAARGRVLGAEPTTPLVSARRVPRWTTELTAQRSLAEAVAPLAATAPGTTCVGVGMGGETIYSLNGTPSLTPASNQKLLTAATALDILGADTTLSTRFLAGGPPVDGVLTGDLWMVGGGDPVITTDARAGGAGDTGRLQTDLESVADMLVALGITQVTGSVVGDDSRHDTARLLPGWPERWLAGGTVAPLSALLVNDGWQVDPTTGEGPGGATPNPPAHAAAALTQLLTERGVQVVGAPSAGTAPASMEEVMAVASPTIGQLAQQLLTFSDNTTGELLLREIGLAVSGEGSSAAGAAAVAEWAATKGLPVEGTAVADGSGLSSANNVTCELLAGLLRLDGPDGPLAGGLAIPGQPGTLSDRFPGVEWSARLRAKTGTLNEVTSLSGWLLTRPGEYLDFSIVTNTADRRVTPDDIAFQNQLLTVLLDQPVERPLEQAGPVAPADA